MAANIFRTIVTFPYGQQSKETVLWKARNNYKT